MKRDMRYKQLSCKHKNLQRRIFNHDPAFLVPGESSVSTSLTLAITSPPQDEGSKGLVCPGALGVVIGDNESAKVLDEASGRLPRMLATKSGSG